MQVLLNSKSLMGITSWWTTINELQLPHPFVPNIIITNVYFSLLFPLLTGKKNYFFPFPFKFHRRRILLTNLMYSKSHMFLYQRVVYYYTIWKNFVSEMPSSLSTIYSLEYSIIIILKIAFELLQRLENVRFP